MPNRESVVVERRREIEHEGATVPFGVGELQRAAGDALSPAVYKYLVGGAGIGETVRANRTAFDRWRIRPRVFRDVAERSLDIELFGKSLRSPVCLAPIGVQSLFDEAGELASARAAASLGVPFSLSSASTHSIEEVADDADTAAADDDTDDAPRYFQLYWLPDWEITRSLVDRAEEAGYDAILLTVDFPTARWMPQSVVDADEITPPLTNLETDPVADDRISESDALLERDASVTWEDLAKLRAHTDLPVVVKGVVHPDDARLAVEHGADGVIVSNHGGRQVDGSVGAVQALPAVVDAVGEETAVLFDSGIRTGADTFKALALGADAVFLGRPYIYGLAVAGERGVYEVLHNHLAELDTVVGLAGYTDMNEVGRAALTETRC